MSGQVDVLAVLDEYIEAFGILRGADELREVRAAVAALIAERDALREALVKLVEAADTSDECRYGTLATGFVRDIARAAIEEAIAAYDPNCGARTVRVAERLDEYLEKEHGVRIGRQAAIAALTAALAAQQQGGAK